MKKRVTGIRGRRRRHLLGTLWKRDDIGY